MTKAKDDMQGLKGCDWSLWPCDQCPAWPRGAALSCSDWQTCGPFQDFMATKKR